MIKFINVYIGFLKKFLRLERSLRIVFDCSNGTTGPILRRLLKAENHKLKALFINDKPDGNFPGHGPNPMLKGATEQLETAVRRERANLGIIFDADGDRALIIDNQGRLLHPDIVAYLLIWYLGPKKVVINTPTGWLVRNLKLQGVKIFESPVGYYFVSRLMRKTNSRFAAEHSAHYYFGNFFCRDAGILAAILIINAVSLLPYRLSEFVDLLPQYHRSWEVNFIVKDKDRLLKIIEKKNGKGVRKISHSDGLTMEFDDWWFNVRPSQNEPLLRLNIETTSKKLLNQKTMSLKKIILSSKN